jgi:predicted transcriptional regulator
MPRIYEKKKASQIDHELVEKCVKMTREDGLTIRAAAERFGMSKTTVNSHLYTTPLPSAGHLPCLPASVEADITTTTKTAAAHGFGISRQEPRQFETFVVRKWNDDDEVGQHLRKNCRFVDKALGKLCYRHKLLLELHIWYH